MPAGVADLVLGLGSGRRNSEQAQSKLDALTEKLAKILTAYNPIPMIGQIAYLSTLSVTPEGDPYATFGSAARAQYLVGVAESADARPTAPPGPAQIQAIIDRPSPASRTSVSHVPESSRPPGGEKPLAHLSGALHLAFRCLGAIP